jgi:hypothetical protein
MGIVSDQRLKRHGSETAVYKKATAVDKKYTKPRAHPETWVTFWTGEWLTLLLMVSCPWLLRLWSCGQGGGVVYQKICEAQNGRRVQT